MVVPDYNPNVRDAELCEDHWLTSIANLISSRAMRDFIFFKKKYCFCLAQPTKSPIFLGSNQSTTEFNPSQALNYILRDKNLNIKTTQISSDEAFHGNDSIKVVEGQQESSEGKGAYYQLR